MEHVTWGLIVACGKSEQMLPEVDIPFLDLCGKPILTYSLLAYEKCQDIDGVVLVVAKERIESVQTMTQMFGCSKIRKVIAGGSHRQSCVALGLKAMDEDVTLVSVHEASRPCITSDLISETVKAAKRYGSGVAALPVPDVIKEVKKGLTVKETLDHHSLWAVQSPQTFKKDALVKGYDLANRKKKVLEDDASAVELLAKDDIHLIESQPQNFKIRTADDLRTAANLLHG